MKKYLLLLPLLLFAGNVYAATMSDVSMLSMVTKAMAPAADKLMTQSIKWLGVFASLQFVVTNFTLLKQGSSIEEVFAKLMGSFTWITFCVYVINHGPAFISDVGHQLFGVVGLSLPSPGAIIGTTVTVVSTLAALAAGVGIVSTTSGMLIVYVLLGLFGIGMYFAAKIFMIQLELGFVAMLSPLSFSMLGLSALRDQGIAPFKALISLAYRIILMTVILSAYTEVGNVVSTTLGSFDVTTLTTTGIGTFVMTIMTALGVYVLMLYALFKSDSIAAALASGTTNMGPADMASAAAMGAAAGAAAVTGGASAVAGVGQVGQSMGNFMKSLATDGASLSNASSIGSGWAPVGPAPSQANFSAGSSQNSAPNRPPRRPSPSGESKAVASDSSPGGFRKPSQATPSTAISAPTDNVQGSNKAFGSAGNSTISGPKSEVGQPKVGDKKGSLDHLRELNQHIAQESAPVHVSINPHHAD